MFTASDVVVIMCVVLVAAAVLLFAKDDPYDLP